VTALRTAKARRILMRLELVRDGDRGSPLGVAEADDNSTDISEALSEIETQAVAVLEAEQDAKKEKQEALGGPVQSDVDKEKEAKQTASASSSSKK
jgi:hypothetical protein